MIMFFSNWKIKNECEDVVDKGQEQQSNWGNHDNHVIPAPHSWILVIMLKEIQAHGGHDSTPREM